jgi:phosphopantetheinyl transferase (holo-ACP synthase)
MKYSDVNWLKEMVKHHEMAIEMSNEAILKSKNNDVLDLANGINETQSKEINVMNDLISEIETKNENKTSLKNIKVLEFPDKEFATKEELFKALISNKKELVSLKKSSTKNADAVSCGYIDTTVKIDTNKEDIAGQMANLSQLNVKVVINTTNFLDSHGDVHVKGIWNKSIKDNVSFLHLQEHERDFDKVITDTAKGYVKTMTWKSLGFSYTGSTDALIFESTIDKKRNEFMLNQYANGWVKNHSVGMRYVQMELAINTEAEYDKEYKALWDEYYPIIANKEVADERGYFWIISEAKIVEGSAVVMGSNSATPTLETKEELEPSKDTLDNEPSLDTQKDLVKQFLTSIKI